MYIVFNLIVIGLVLLIAYWWANQGLFSALLHLVSVIVAAAVAFGIWEPLVVGLLLRDGWFDHYAWGVALIGVFAVVLFVLRFAFDKLAPANVDLPRWADMGGGLPVGFAAGVITMGVVVIGAGFMQSSSEIFGWRGYGRSSTNGQVVRFNQKLWLPVHYWTDELFSLMSGGSMWTPQPMRDLQPDLYWQLSLVRDTYDAGKGQVTMPPDAMRVVGYYHDPSANTAAVNLRFNAKGIDFGDQLTLSASQVRLISAPRGRGGADVEHPEAWVQDGTRYLFDNISHFITSTPGQEQAEAIVLFRLEPGFTPRYVQVRNVRYRLPAAQQMPAGLFSGSAVDLPGDGGGATVDLSAQPIPEAEIRVSNSIRPVRVSANRMPGSMEEQDRLLVEGEGEFNTGGGGSISRSLLIQGVYEPPGTRMVMLDVSRGAACDLFRKGLRETLPEGAHMALVDADGNTYSPIGYIHKRADNKYGITLAPGRFIRTLDQLPYLPTSGAEDLDLYFRVTLNATIVGFKIGDRTLGTCQLQVLPK